MWLPQNKDPWGGRPAECGVYLRFGMGDLSHVGVGGLSLPRGRGGSQNLPLRRCDVIDLEGEVKLPMFSARR